MNKSGTIHERITQLVDTFGKGKNTVFASLIGSNEANVRGYKTSVMPKFDFLEKIARNLDIDLKWLLTGEGSMLRTDGAAGILVTPPTDTPIQSDTVVLRLMDKIDEKDNIIKEKEAENKQLQSELLSAKEELAALKAKYPKESADNPVVLKTAKPASTKKRSSQPDAGSATSANVPSK